MLISMYALKSFSCFRWTTLPCLGVARWRLNLVWLLDGENESPDRGRVYALGGLLADNDVTAMVEVLDLHYDGLFNKTAGDYLHPC